MIYKPYYYKEQKWYSLEDLLKIRAEAISPKPEVVEFGTYHILNLITDVFPNRLPFITYGIGTSSPKPHIFELSQYITNRYLRHYCLHCEEELTAYSILRNKYVREFIAKVSNVISFTYDKYASLLDFYSTEKSNLMKAIKSTASGNTRFNDTPQDSGLFEDDEHTTNITQVHSTSETDGDTKIRRLNEIDKLYNNLMLEWCDEFDKLFIEEINLWNIHL